MWLLVFIPAVLGVAKYRYASYWRWVGAMWLWQAAATYLFASYGSLEQPERDGLISRAIRLMTDDGPLFGLYGIVFLVVFYGGVAYFVRHLYVEARRPNEGAIAYASKGRKAIELTALTLLTAGLLYSNFAATLAADVDAPSAPTVEARIEREIAMATPLVATKLDDITILTGVRGDQQTLTYDYEITTPAFTREAFTAYLADEKPAEACAHANTRGIVQDGGVVRYRYKLAAGGDPVSLELTAAHCAALASAPQKNSSISR
ncbi:MAG: hypothetical protein C0481_14740 [Phenylobacterium sp.]|uniref:hypothetical protein n=1 Tax=Phenylobacterium sp. TaxID=1871053 RepID=UPI0025CF6C14|nr:hypothetical protein [Phenylobacterium sp.]MBA4013120.1 hypothetical protein [Phenylobacterium sp.]